MIGIKTYKPAAIATMARTVPFPVLRMKAAHTASRAAAWAEGEVFV